LEFQGEILGDLIGELGTVLIKKGGLVAEMDIGQHVLEGEAVTLKQPFLVIEKVGSGSQRLDVVGIARRKLLFKTRPKPKSNKK